MKLRNSLLVAGMAATICMAVPTVLAQNEGGGGGRRFGGGNFDPAQFQQRMMENIRDEMSVTNDQEWKVIEARVQKVMEARRDAGPPGFGRMFRARRGDNNGDNGPGPGRRGGFFGGTPMPELEALNNAVDAKAPTDQIKAAMEKYRAARQAKEVALEKAQDDLKAVLTPRQEAVALASGLVR